MLIIILAIVAGALACMAWKQGSLWNFHGEDEHGHGGNGHGGH